MDRSVERGSEDSPCSR